MYHPTQARQARVSSEMLMTELEQLRYDKSHTAGVVDAMRRDMAQAQHDLYVAHELNAQLQRDVAAVKDDQVWVRDFPVLLWVTG
jgi:uncharacterized protein (DUF3084 family)